MHGDYLRMANRYGRKYINGKWPNYKMIRERYTATLCWEVARSEFEQSETYRQIFNDRYDGDFEEIIRGILKKSEEMYEQILPLVKTF